MYYDNVYIYIYIYCITPIIHDNIFPYLFPSGVHPRHLLRVPLRHRHQRAGGHHDFVGAALAQHGILCDELAAGLRDTASCG